MERCVRMELGGERHKAYLLSAGYPTLQDRRVASYVRIVQYRQELVGGTCTESPLSAVCTVIRLCLWVSGSRLLEA